MKSTAGSDSKVAWLIWAVVVLYVMHHLPYGGLVAYPLMLLDTMAHEMGHGLTALLVGGRFESLHLHSDGSGLALTAFQAGWPQALVSAGGLLGPAVAAALAFLFGRSARGAKICLTAAGLGVLLCLAVFVRGGTAWFCLVAVGLALLWLGLRAGPGVARLGLLFVATDFCLLVFTRGDYLFTRQVEIAGQTIPSDVEAISLAIGLPYWFWGVVVGLISVAILLLGVRLYLARGFRGGPQKN